MAEILNGKELAKKIRTNLKVEVEELNEDNATILNDATDEELQMLIYRIYQNLGLI